jgi:serine protease Do
MRHTFTTSIAVLALAAMPLAAQTAPRAKVRSASAPEVWTMDAGIGRSYLGVEIADIGSDRVQALKLKEDRGVEVTSVDQDAPAGKAGLKEHDVIVGYNGTRVEGQEQFRRLLRETPPGRTVAIDIIRDGQPQSLKAQLADRAKFMPQFPKTPDIELAMPPMPVMPAMPAMPEIPRAWVDGTVTRIYRSSSGATLESLSSQLGEFFGVKNGEGMLVRSVQKGSPAEAAGLRAGDVVVKVNDQKITDHADWTDALREARNEKVNVVIVREKKEQTLSMSVPPRRGPDSSALIIGSPEFEAGMDELSSSLAELGPQLRMAIGEAARAGSRAAIELRAGRPEIERAMRQAAESLRKIQFDFDDMQ